MQTLYNIIFTLGKFYQKFANGSKYYMCSVILTEHQQQN